MKYIVVSEYQIKEYVKRLVPLDSIRLIQELEDEEKEGDNISQIDLDGDDYLQCLDTFDELVAKIDAANKTA